MRNLRGVSIGNCGKEEVFAVYKVGFALTSGRRSKHFPDDISKAENPDIEQP